MEDKEYYTIREFAVKMRVTERTVYRWIKHKFIKAVQVAKGGKIRILHEELERIKQ